MNQDIIIIAAKAKNGVIGKKGAMPWHIKEDLAHFRKVTMGHHLVMGRRTFTSLGDKPLDGRVNVVVSNKDINNPDAKWAPSIKEAFLLCCLQSKIFIIGGGDIYKQTIALANKMIITEIPKEYQGDTYFPKYDTTQWQEQDRCEYPTFNVVSYEKVI